MPSQQQLARLLLQTEDSSQNRLSPCYKSIITPPFVFWLVYMHSALRAPHALGLVHIYSPQHSRGVITNTNNMKICCFFATWHVSSDSITYNILHYTALYCTVLYCTVLYYITYNTLYCTVLYCIISHITHCIVLYCTVLYCTVLYHI